MMQDMNATLHSNTFHPAPQSFDRQWRSDKLQRKTLCFYGKCPEDIVSALHYARSLLSIPIPAFITQRGCLTVLHISNVPVDQQLAVPCRLQFNQQLQILCRSLALSGCKFAPMIESSSKKLAARSLIGIDFGDQRALRNEREGEYGSLEDRKLETFLTTPLQSSLLYGLIPSASEINPAYIVMVGGGRAYRERAAVIYGRDNDTFARELLQAARRTEQKKFSIEIFCKERVYTWHCGREA